MVAKISIFVWEMNSVFESHIFNGKRKNVYSRQKIYRGAYYCMYMARSLLLVCFILILAVLTILLTSDCNTVQGRVVHYIMFAARRFTNAYI